MAVSNIQYTKILNDSDWIPKKLEDVYVSKLMNPYSNIESEETTFRLMPTKGEAATILRRRNTQPVEPQPVAEEETIIAETPIETPTSMPMTIDSPWFTGENLQAGSDNEAIWNSVFQQYAEKFGLKDETAYKYLLGQLKHESGDFNYMEELASGDAYEGRADLGNTRRGDGRRYKGRGPIQVTGRSNYKQIYDNFFVPNGLGEYDIVAHPELGSDPRIGSLMSIGWLLTTKNGRRAIEAANNHSLRDITKAINGGYNGYASREAITNELIAGRTYA